jgi:hypothetical protein
MNCEAADSDACLATAAAVPGETLCADQRSLRNVSFSLLEKKPDRLDEPIVLFVGVDSWIYLIPSRYRSDLLPNSHTSPSHHAFRGVRVFPALLPASLAGCGPADLPRHDGAQENLNFGRVSAAT